MHRLDGLIIGVILHALAADLVSLCPYIIDFDQELVASSSSREFFYQYMLLMTTMPMTILIRRVITLEMKGFTLHLRAGHRL